MPLRLPYPLSREHAPRRHRPTWTEETVTNGTRVSVFDLMELRSAIYTNRASLGLATGGWTDEEIVAGRDVAVRAVHLTQLKDKVQDLWTTAGLGMLPEFSAGPITVGNRVRTFAVVTNDWQTEGRTLLEWQRGKAGTVEHVNRVIKDELAGGVYPSGKFGANAAWLRLQVITANLMELLKAVALDEEYRHAWPKRLRFRIFTQFSRVVRHAGTSFIRLATHVLECLLRPGRRRLLLAAWPAP